MQINSKNILARIYLFNYTWMSDGWTKRETNLCHFMRVIFFWVPVKLLFSVVIFSLVLLGVMVAPILEFGAVLYVTGVLLIISIIYLIYLLANHPWGDIEYPRSETSDIVFSYFKAIKQKVCPLIHIK